MISDVKMILNGMPVRYLCEGEMSDIHIELTGWLEDLRNKGKKYGDFKLTSPANSYEVIFKDEFDKFISKLDKYSMNVKSFVDLEIADNPDISFLCMLDKIQEKFL